VMSKPIIFVSLSFSLSNILWMNLDILLSMLYLSCASLLQVGSKLFLVPNEENVFLFVDFLKEKTKMAEFKLISENFCVKSEETNGIFEFLKLSQSEPKSEYIIDLKINNLGFFR
jgi:hypothetical protein